MPTPERYKRDRQLYLDSSRQYRRTHDTYRPNYYRLHWRVRRLELMYGLKPGQYETLLAAQGGGCAICGRTDPGGRGLFHVDHDHANNCVRGLLCQRCNMGLGLFNDNSTVLANAIRYLRPGFNLLMALIRLLTG